MVWYAETTGRRVRQVLADVAMVVWVALWWQLSRLTHDLVAALGTPGRGLAGVGERLGSSFRDIAGVFDGAPLVGDALEAPFTELAGAADAIGGFGAAQDAAAGTLADWLGALVLLLPVLAVGLFWFTSRLRGARRAGSARRLRDQGEDDLLALRALTTRPVAELLAVSDTPAADWRAGNTRDLAALELHRLGLRSRT